ncbi:MAG: response regulator [Bacteroidetes bacterium]|nr:response regulator [Bacteroidota bacterium]
MNHQAIEILLVEDSMEDAELTIRALRKNNLANNLLHLEDGEEALEFLFNTDSVAPRLILLDLKMPKVDGMEVLRRLKSDPVRRIIPVVVMTSSKEERDIVEAHHLGVNAYVVKPVDFDQFVRAVTETGLFWMVLNQTPASKGHE